jgi:DNA-binding GntR family transcriptional regulator
MQSRQAAARLYQLLPNRLNQLVAEYRREHKAAKAMRLALADPRYQEAVEQYLKVLGTAVESRIIWEVHSMLYNAYRSTSRSETPPAKRWRFSR